MPDLILKCNDHRISLTKIEFTLITKALVGALSPKDKNNKNGFPDGFNEVKEARKLGEDLLERRVKCLEQETGASETALEKAIALWNDDEGGE